MGLTEKEKLKRRILQQKGRKDVGTQKGVGRFELEVRK